jgi:hypothetical protein
LVIGKVYIDVIGKTQVVNHSTGDRCDMEWKERGWNAKNAYMIVGTVKNEEGKSSYKIYGKMIESLRVVNLET